MRTAITERQAILRQQGEELAHKLSKEAEWISKNMGRDDLSPAQFRKLQMQSELVLSVAQYISALQSDWEECYQWLGILQKETAALKNSTQFQKDKARHHQHQHVGLRKGISKAFKELSTKLRAIEADYENRPAQ